MAGIAAAITCARRGLRSVLIEKSFGLGGLATRGLINWLEPYCDGAGQRVLGGVAWEVFQLAVNCGYQTLSADWREGIPKANGPRLASWFSPERFMLEVEAWLVEAGVHLLYDTWAVQPVMNGSRCEGLLLECKEGRRFLPAGTVIDASGDAEICCKAGMPCECGENYLTMTVYLASTASAQAAAVQNQPYLVRERSRFGANMHGVNHPEGEPLTVGTMAEELTAYTIRSHRLMLEKLKGNQEVLSLPQMPQLSTIRHMVGDAVFLGTEDHVNCVSSIGVIPDYMQRGSLFELPFGCLYNRKFDNLLAAGRIISCKGRGWHVSRVIGPVLLTGQAAAEAAALLVSCRQTVQTLEASVVQQRLAQTGVAIHIGQLGKQA